MNEQFLPELTAMQQISSIVCNLSLAERKRVAAWLMEYASQELESPKENEPAVEYDEIVESESSAEEIPPSDEPEEKVYSTFDQFFEAAAPKKGAQKAAVAAYWLETQGGQRSWKAFDISRLLKSIDQSVSSISIVLTNAVKAKNPLVVELERTGDGGHSRKTFCLSEQGLAYVEGQLA